MTANITNEKLFKHLVQQVEDYAIFALDQDGHVVTWNAGAQRIKGYTADEIVGKHFSVFYADDLLSKGHPQFELQQALKNGSYEEEGWRIRKDGTQFWALVVITALYDDDGRHFGFTKVTRDLSERRQNELALEKARDEAIAANRLKSQFVTNVTHEIRTPLSSIVGLSELLCSESEGDPELNATAIRVFDSSKILLSLLNELLDFAKLEAGKITVESVPYSVRKVIEDVIGLMSHRASQTGLKLTASVSETVPESVMGDPSKVRQILLNLVQNAIKFTETGGIELTADIKDRHILLTVTDTGIGIAPEAQEKLFQPFSQAHNSTSRMYGGTGLGLSIAQQFAQLMEGEIGLVSHPGQGSSFWVALPLLSA